MKICGLDLVAERALLKCLSSCSIISWFGCDSLHGGNGYPAREFCSQQCFRYYYFNHCYAMFVSKEKFDPLQWHHVISVVDTMCQRLSVNDWTMDMATKQEKSSLSNVSGINLSTTMFFFYIYESLILLCNDIKFFYIVETMCQRLNLNDWTVDMATKLEKSDPSNVSGIILSLPCVIHHIILHSHT